MSVRPLLKLAPMLALTALLAAGCPSDDPDPGATDTADIEQDGVADAADASDTDDDATPPDAEQDVEGDTDVIEPPESCREIGEITYSAGSCENSCLDENGKSKKTLCPDPISEWDCVQGCCVPVFQCQTDADCLVFGYDKGQCDDTRFDCRCDTASGQCQTWYCAVDSECCDGWTCAGGACEEAPADTSGFELVIVSKPSTLTPGATLQLLAEARDPADPDVVLPVAVTWSSDAEDTVSVEAEGGLATGGTTAGTATITATAGTAEATVTLTNVVPDGGDTLTVITTVARTGLPLAGRYALVESITGTVLVTDDIPADGVIRFSDPIPSNGVDIHVFGEGTDWISWLGSQGGVVLLPAPETVYSAIELDQEENLVAADTTLVNSNILKGAPDFSSYPKGGEFEVSLNSFALSTALLDFSLPALLGANVVRYFDPDFALSGLVDVTEEAEVPGGLTFGVESPAIPHFHLGAPAGDQTLWTLGGRAELSEVSPLIGDIIDAVGGGDLDIGSIVTAIIPIFETFYSAVTPGLSFAGDGSTDVTDVTPELRMPLGLAVELSVPTLPDLGGGMWAEVVFMLGGALTADGAFVPLGINAAADTNDPEANPADGVADFDPDTPEKDPFVLKMAPLHSSLTGPYTQYALAAVALSVDPGGDSERKDGGSAILVRSGTGQALPAAPDLGDFLPFPNGSNWDETPRAITVAPTGTVDGQRILFKGKRGENWTIWLNGTTDYLVPVPADVLGDAEVVDRATVDVELVLVNTFDFATDVNLSDIVAPGGTSLSELLLVTDRVSFLNIRP